MAFQLTLDDFNKLAFDALQHPDNSDFEKSAVATRLRNVITAQNLGPASKSDSLELRKNLASVINGLYTVDNAVRIPASVLKALNVDKFASGFEIKNGTLVATNHPLTDRRLVAIMTAIKLAQDDLGVKCRTLRDDVAAFRNNDHSPNVRAFAESAATVFDTLTQTIAPAAEQKVKPGTLKLFMGRLDNAINRVKELYTALETSFPEAERPALRDLVNRMVELGETFGSQVARLPGPAAQDNHVLVNVNDVRILDAVLEDVELPQTDPAAIFAEHKDAVRTAVQNQTGTALKGLGLNLNELITYSDADAEALRADNEAATTRASEKARAIAAGINRINRANLDKARKIELFKAAIAANGVVDEARLAAAEKDYRTETYQAIAEEAKGALEKDVADAVRALLANDPTCTPGLENLTRDFPKMDNFAKRVKADHKGGALATFDLRAPGTLEAKIAGKLETAKATLLGKVDADTEEIAFRASLADVTQATAEAIAARLKKALAAPVFEDDRTILADLALDPAKADEFETKLDEARKTYDGKVIARIEQSLMAGKVALAQQKPSAKEAEFTTSTAFRELYDVRFAPEAPNVEKPTKVRKQAKDAEDRFSKDVNAAATLKASIRNLFADLFTAKTHKAEGVKALLLANADTLQAMLLDPALLESTAVPGDGKGGGDAVRKLLGHLLAAIGPNVNNGQLAAADFRAALKAALSEGTSVDNFTNALRDAGRKVLAAMQTQLTAKLTNVLRTLAGGGEKLKINEKTLAELGASGLGSFDEGYGKFLANVLDHYFTDETLETDRDRMLESFFRNGKDGGTTGEALSALIKGAGPIFQKVLQSIPVEGLPEEIVKALVDVKSGLAPIPRDIVQKRVDDYIADYNRAHPGDAITGYSIDKSLGAASVGQAVLCTFSFASKEKKTVVVKFLRPEIETIATRERAFFDKWAKAVSPEMGKTFGARMDGIMEELDFSNEAKYIKAGQCYGVAGNYGNAAYLNDATRLKFKSMNVAENFQPVGGMKPVKDMIILDVASGRPLDRSNRDTRMQLDAITKRLTKSVPDGKGGQIKVCQASTGFDLVATRMKLQQMYQTTNDRRTMLEELIRRFSSELIARNFDGKSTGGGFMHGDLHGGNLLVDDSSMTVIDFGNSFQFDAIDRKGLISFIAACGFSNADLVLSTIDNLNQTRHEQLVKSGNLPKGTPVPAKLSRRNDFAVLKKGIQDIVGKGDANDVVARGMAVVQYLQRMKVEVPGPMVNFTETVMRLSTAHAETTAILNDIGETIEALQLDPQADTTYDFFAAAGDGLFKANTQRDKIIYTSPAGEQFKSLVGKLQRYADNPVNPNDYDQIVRPFVALLRKVSYPIPADPQGRTIGEAVTLIAKKLELLGDGNFQPGDERVKNLLDDLLTVYIRGVYDLQMKFEKMTDWKPLFGQSLNKCLSVGVDQVGRETLVKTVGVLNAGGMLAQMGSVNDKADLTIRQREMSNVARKRYRREIGLIPPETRRLVDRLVGEHFIWSEDKPEKIFSANKWYANTGAATAVKNVLALNLGKLNKALVSANLTGGEMIENFALIPFAFRAGLPQALAKLTDPQFATLCQNVGNATIVGKLTFFRTHPSVIEAVQIGRTLEAGDKAGVTLSGMLDCYSETQQHFPSLEKPITFAPETLPTLVKTLAERYDYLLTWAGTEKGPDGEPQPNGLKDDQIAALADCGFMRYLLDEGFLQELKKRPAPEQKQILAAFSNKVNLSSHKKKKLPNLAPVLNHFLEYMK